MKTRPTKNDEIFVTFLCNTMVVLNFIVQAVLTAVSQIINIVQQTKKRKDENKSDQE